MEPRTPLLNRRSARSSVFLTAVVEVEGATLSVKVRDLSTGGAKVEGARLPAAGSALLFRRGQSTIPGRLAWLRGNRAGIAFQVQLSPGRMLAKAG